MNVRVPICMQIEIKKHLCLLSAELRAYISTYFAKTTFPPAGIKKAENLFQNTYANLKGLECVTKVKAFRGIL